MSTMAAISNTIASESSHETSMVGSRNGSLASASVFIWPPIETSEPTEMIVPNRSDRVMAERPHAVFFISASTYQSGRQGRRSQ
jgi:hypothetical protein